MLREINETTDPIACLSAPGAAWAPVVAAALRDAGWAVHSAALPAARALGLVLVDEGGVATGRTGWAGAGWVALVAPAAVPAAIAAGCDEALTLPLSPSEAAALAVRWRPRPLGDATRRLIATFGEGAIAPLLAGLADQLEDGLRALDGPGVKPLAHRLAGLAGTLGFAALSEMWRALSDGGGAGPGLLRSESRLAIGSIGRWAGAG